MELVSWLELLLLSVGDLILFVLLSLLVMMSRRFFFSFIFMSSLVSMMMESECLEFSVSPVSTTQAVSMEMRKEGQREQESIQWR